METARALTERLPPHSLDGEESVLGALLIDGSAIDCVRYHLKPDHFYYANNQLMYSACLALAERRQSIDQITVAEELNRMGQLETCGGTANLSRLISLCPTALDIESYSQVVHRLFVSRELIKLGGHIADIGYQAGPDPNQAIQEAMTAAEKLQREHTELTSIVSSYQVSQEILNLIGRYNEDKHALSWGFKALDELTTGLYRGELVIVGGLRSHGKTQFLLDSAENMAAANPETQLLFVTAEMSMPMIEERKIAREVGISVKDLRLKGLQESLDGNLVALAGRVSEQNINYLAEDQTSTSVHQWAERLKRSKGLDIVFIDYLGRLLDAFPEKGHNTNEAVSRVSKNLKSMAKALDVPVVAACQLHRIMDTRTGVERAPKLADLRDSGSIEQDADVVLLLHRTPEKPNILQVGLAKHRQIGASEHPVILTWSKERHRYEG